MNIKNLLNTAKVYSKIAFLKVKKNAPTILTISGCAGFVTTTVIACRATMKLNAAIEAGNNEIAACEEYAATHEETSDMSAQEMQLAVRGAKIRKVWGITKLYIPTAVLGGTSIFMVLFAHHIMRARNIALTGAYAAVCTAYSNYRKRVAKEFGEEVDDAIYYGKTIKSETKIDPETGESTTVETVEVNDDCALHRYWFDESCRGFVDDPRWNYDLLTNIEDRLNDQLKNEKFFTANDILSKCGFPKKREYAELGIVYDPNGGDHQIDFGLRRKDKEVRDFVNGYTSKVPLTFNFSVNVFDELEKMKGVCNETK